MDSDEYSDEITVAMSSPASKATTGEKRTATSKAKQPARTDSAKASTAIELAGSSRESSPLSDVDEEVLISAPTSSLEDIASNESLLPQTSSPSLASSSGPSAPASSDLSGSSPPAQRPDSKRTAAHRAPSNRIEPSSKRVRRSPRKSSSCSDSASSEYKGPASDFEPEEVEDHLLKRPSNKNLIGPNHGPGSKKIPRKGHLALTPKGSTARQRELREKRAEPKAGNENYEPLRLYDGSSNWVLFDPLKSFPKAFDSPPDFIERFARYNPGNGRILEYNLKSKSVRLKSTPKVLRGKSVIYREDGPRLRK